MPSSGWPISCAQPSRKPALTRAPLTFIPPPGRLDLPDGLYRCRVFPTSEPVLREKRAGRWYLPGTTVAIGIETWHSTRQALPHGHPGLVTDQIYAEILPVAPEPTDGR